jgi:hypothetical protein
MNATTLWSERFGMLLASGSPGSALAYQLGCTLARADIPHRNIDGQERPRPVSPARLSDDSTRRASWLRRCFERVQAWYATAEMREVEGYLAQAQNVADLEHRMRCLSDAVRERRIELLR